MPSVLFVCLGNICRSPTAEAVLKKKAKLCGVDLITPSYASRFFYLRLCVGDG